MKRRYFFILITFLIGCKKSTDGTVDAVPLAPTELKGAVYSINQIDLTWKDNSTNENGYKIQRKTGSGVYTEIGSTANDVSTYSDKTVIANTLYTYRIFSFNKAGKSIEYSNELSLNTAEAFTFSTVVGANGRIWMDRNLGASRVAASITDVSSYGDLYQWGRGKDGHQLRTSSTTGTQSIGDFPGNANFIVGFADWRSTSNNNLWQGVTGINNPCPSGFRLPTEEEWNTERKNWVSNNAAGAFASSLKLPLSGYRSNNGTIIFAGQNVNYWSSTTSGDRNYLLSFNDVTATVAVTATINRAYGFCIRCIKD